MDEITVPDSTVKMPQPVSRELAPSKRKVSPYLKLFEKGPTPEGEAYPLSLPTERTEYLKARTRVANRIRLARDKFNARQLSKKDHLQFRIKSEPGIMYVIIVKKYGGTR